VTDNEVRIVVTGENRSQQALSAATRATEQFQRTTTQRMSVLQQALARTGQQAGRDLGQGISDGASHTTQNVVQDETRRVSVLQQALARVGQHAGQDLGQGIADGAQHGTRQLTTEQQAALDRIKTMYEQRAREAGTIVVTRLSEAGTRAGEDLGNNLGDAADTKVKGIGGRLGELIGGNLKGALLGGVAAVAAAAATVGIAAGVALAAALKTSIEGALAQQTLTSKLAAQLGLNPQEAARAGKLAGSVYAQNYGESWEQVNDALRHVSLDLGDLRKASDDSVTGMTENVLNLAAAYDQDVGGVTRALSKMLSTGLVKDAKQGFDLLTRGFQVGADQAEDFLDTMNEYSTKFRDVGVDGPHAIGMISQALKAGARDGDLAADAIKEFAIRSKDGSTTSEAGFKSLGFNAKQMFATFAKGGPDADKAMKQVLDRLKAMKDPLEQNATATALFGTQAEDLGQALYAIDPTTAVAALGQVDGAAQQLGDTLGNTVQGKIDSFKRTVEVRMDQVGQLFLRMFNEVANSPEVQEFADKFSKVIGPAIEKFTDWFMSDIYPQLVTFFRDVFEKGAVALDYLKEALHNNGPELKQLADMIAGGVGPAFDFLSNCLGVTIHMFSDLISIVGFVIDVYNTLLYTAQGFADSFLNVCETILTAAVVSFSWIPGIGPKLQDAAASFTKFRNSVTDKLNEISNTARGIPNPNIQVSVSGSANALERLSEINRAIRNMPSVNAFEHSAGYAHGGVVGAATGGVHGGLRLVGEQGPELVTLPYGSTVHPAGATRNMLADGGGGGGVVDINVNLSGAETALLSWIRKTVRIEGAGDVQVAFGRA
jgi:phage-related minor tail protein